MFTSKRSEHLAMYQMAVGAMPVGNSGTLSEAALHLPKISALGFTAIQLLPLTLHHRVEWRKGVDSVWVKKGQLRSGPRSSGMEWPPGSLSTRRSGLQTSLRDSSTARTVRGSPSEVVRVDLVFGHVPVSETALGTFLPKSAAPEKNHFGPLPDFGQPEVTSLALASLRSWLTAFRVDGVRIDTAVDLRKTNVGKALLRAIVLPALRGSLAPSSSRKRFTATSQEHQWQEELCKCRPGPLRFSLGREPSARAGSRSPHPVSSHAPVSSSRRQLRSYCYGRCCEASLGGFHMQGRPTSGQPRAVRVQS